MASSYGKIAVTADTPVQVAGPGAPAETHARTGKIKMTFIPDTAAVCQVGTEADLMGDTGFVFFAGDTGESNDFELVSNEELWFVATDDGELRFRRQ